ncbi:hypothetical protein FSP39_003018 [Pinctada imbricata]|uniref:GH3 domain-containing protein n=1 Tax=Pinctada imbricata TaxID=66713 RepID=A0AA88Y6X1_PINIB|nr:hypothetical protein FSP39_003018 [Pinctada imbricata]
MNAETEYGKTYNFSEIKSREDFVQQHPLTFISHYKSYVDKMMEGKDDILTKDKPIIFAVTSGTSGTSSVLPMTQRQRINFFVQGVAVVYHSMLQAFPDSRKLQKSLKFFYTPRWRTCEAGVPVGPNSSSPTNTRQLLNVYSTPKAGFEILSEPEALYIHLLFGMKDKHIGMLEANFSSIILSSFKALDIHWKDIIEDIEKGRVNPNLKIDDDVRNELDKVLKPDSSRAQELREAFEGGPIGLAKRIWPNCHLMLAADSGSFELPANILRETYCKNLPIYSPLYAASEGLLGVNVWPLKHPSHYLLAPKSMFFEFIPVEHCKEDQPATLFLDQVQLGEEYELVISTAGGFWRYRFGDVVRVTGFYNQCPIIEFMYRQGQFLNVRGEKTSESSFYQALSKACESWSDIKLVDYCCCESILIDDQGSSWKSYAPTYYVFLELDGSGKLTAEQKNKIDEILAEQSYVYKSFRNKGSIRPMVVKIVRPGTFKELREFTIETTTASANQYKIPRTLKRKEAVNFVLDRVIKGD